MKIMFNSCWGARISSSLIMLCFASAVLAEDTRPPITHPSPPQQFPDSARPFVATQDLQADKAINLKAARARLARGKGLTVAVLDTGLRISHLAFKEKVSQGGFEDRVRAVQNFSTEPDDPLNPVIDHDGHGTHVAGIIASGLAPLGVAPSAGVVALKVFPTTPADWTPIEKALEWVLANYVSYDISVLNLSLGGGNFSTPENFLNDRILSLISQLTSHRIAVVVAAGNNFWEENSTEGMGFPAISSDVISVGATFDSANLASCVTPKDPKWGGPLAYRTKVDQIAPFSQRLAGASYRTTIFAPGTPIVSAGNSTDTNMSYSQDGTSMACPLVCGVVILLQERYRDLRQELPQVEDLKRWLSAGPTFYDEEDPAPVPQPCQMDNVNNTGKMYIRLDVLSALNAMEQELLPPNPLIVSIGVPFVFSETPSADALQARSAIDTYATALAGPSGPFRDKALEFSQIQLKQLALKTMTERDTLSQFVALEASSIRQSMDFGAIDGLQ